LERRTALFVDFDNVFSALYNWAPEAAEAFVLEPTRWLDWVGRRASRVAGPAVPGRVLVRRCYLNPNGSILLRSGERVFFGSFRNNLVRAGLQVSDCPPLTRGGKTSADIVMVMDVLDALQHETRFDEFVVLSSDADFTPVLQRLRAHDRRTLVVSIGNAAGAYRAAADEVIGPEEFIRDALGLGPDAAGRAPAAPEQATAPGRWPAPSFLMDHAEEADPAMTREAILAHVAAELAESPAPLHLPALGKRLHERLGPQVRATGFGGAGSLARLLAAAGDPRIELVPGSGGGWVRDPLRHADTLSDATGESPA
jgi:hypothetical protein